MKTKIPPLVPAVMALILLAPVIAVSQDDALKEAWEKLPAAEKHFQKGLKEFQAGRSREAEAAFRKSAEVLPRHAYAQYYLANIAYIQGNYEEAQARMERALGDLDFMRDLNAYAVDRKSQAISSFQQMLESEWENAVNCRAQREVESADDEINTQKTKLEAQAARERERGILQKAHYQYFLGNIRFQLKRYVEAEAAYREALALNPRHANAYNNAAAIHYLAKNYAKALDLLSEAESRGLGDNVNLKLKHLVYEALGKPTEGILREDLSSDSNGDLGVIRFALAYKFEDPLLPPLYENGYVLYNRTTREAVIIDPGVEDPRIAELVSAKNLAVKAILNTHGHPDHTAADARYAELYKAHVYAPKADESGLKIRPDGEIGDGETMTFDGFAVKAILTPGHTPGSTCYLIGDYLFSGDTLFKNDIVSLQASSAGEEAEARQRLVRLIKEKLLVLGDKTRVCPGHGPTTTIAEEKTGNPFLKD